jgi:ParB family chromosome partitioning protein
VEEIALSSIYVEKYREVDDVQGLAESIRQVGLIHPLLLQEQAERYRLVAGYRRYLAVKELGWRTVPGIILEPDAPVELIRMIENIQREDVDPLSKAEALCQLQHGEKWSVEQLSEMTGMPQSKISYYFNILDLPTKYQIEVLKNFDNGSSPLTLSHVAAAKVVENSLGDSGMFHLILDSVLEYRLTKAETQAIVSLIKRNYNLSMEAALIMVRPGQFRHDTKVTKLSDEVEGLLGAYEAIGNSLEALKEGSIAKSNRKKLLKTVKRVLDQAETTRKIIEKR